MNEYKAVCEFSTQSLGSLSDYRDSTSLAISARSSQGMFEFY